MVFYVLEWKTSVNVGSADNVEAHYTDYYSSSILALSLIVSDKNTIFPW